VTFHHKRRPQERPLDAAAGDPVFFIKKSENNAAFFLWRKEGVPLMDPQGPHFVGFYANELIHGHISRGEYGRNILLVHCIDGESDFKKRIGRANVVVNRFARLRLSLNLLGQSDALWASISKTLSMDDLYLCGLKPGQFEKRQAEFLQSQKKSAEPTGAGKDQP